MKLAVVAWGLALGVLGAALSCSRGVEPLAFEGTRLAPERIASPAPAEDAGERGLPRGEKVPGRLGAGRTVGFALPVPGESFLRIVLLQQGNDLVLTLRDPEGKVVDEQDGPAGARMDEQLTALVGPGEHRVEVRAVDPEATGGFTLLVEELRPARPGDEACVEIERLEAEAVHLSDLTSDPGALERAAELLRRSLAMRQEVGYHDYDYIYWGTLGLVQRIRGRLDEAIAAHERSLEIMERTGVPSRQRAVTHGSLGVALDVKGEVERAEHHFRAALELDGSLTNLRRLMNFLYAWDRHGEVEELLPRAFSRLAEESTEESGDEEAALLNLRGSLRQLDGRFDLAREDYERALRVADAGGMLAAAILHNLGRLERRAGDRQKALELYWEALRINREGGWGLGEAETRSSLAILLFDLGKRDEAVFQSREALELFRELQGHAGRLVLAMRDLGWYLAGKREMEVAGEFMREALELAERAGSPRQLAFALEGSGYIELLEGRSEAAVEAFSRALPLWSEAAELSKRGETLALRGRSLGALGRYEEAVADLHEAVEIARSLAEPAFESGYLLILGQLEQQRGNLAVARGKLEESLGLLESQRCAVESEQLRASFLARNREAYVAYVDVLARLARRAGSEPLALEAFEASERARGRSLVDLLRERRVEPALEPELRRERRRLEAELTALQLEVRRETASGDGTRSRRVAQDLEATRRQLDALEWRIVARSPRYAEICNVRTVGAAEVQRLLPRGAALLEYTLGPTGSYLFVLTRARFELVHLDVSEREVRALVDRGRRGMSSSGGRRELVRHFPEAAAELYRLLVAPAGDVLESVDHLIVAADGPLHYLPFGTLLLSPPAGSAPRDWDYLLGRWSVSYVPAAGVLAMLEERQDGSCAASGLRFAGLADPRYEAGVERLVASEDELHRVAAFFAPESRAVFLRDEATEARVRRPEVQGASILHFAVHGLLDSSAPDYGGLALTVEPGGEEDGWLQVHEIFDFDLCAEMVVLSACETGLGEEVAGEGLVGLARAFLYAGAGSVVVSLWRVDDGSTGDLMTAFYRHLAARATSGEGDPRLRTARALAAAKLEMIRSGVGHPFHWAPFVLVGLPGGVSPWSVTIPAEISPISISRRGPFEAPNPRDPRR